MLAVGLNDRRTDKPVALQVTLRDLLDRLYPGPRKPRPNEYWPRLMRAAEALDAMDARVPWVDPDTGRGQLRCVVSVGGIPRGPVALDDVVRMVVDLPPPADPREKKHWAPHIYDCKRIHLSHRLEIDWLAGSEFDATISFGAAL